MKHVNHCKSFAMIKDFKKSVENKNKMLNKNV